MSDRRVLAGRYEVRSLLGRGGMAEVHEGLDTRLNRTVAIKLLRTDLARDPSFQARLRREAQSAAALNHPSIVAVYDSGEEVLPDPGGEDMHVPFIVMEYVRGKTLRELIKHEGGVSIREALNITAGVLSALQYSHRAGIVHRDIKPANVMLTPAGDVKVMDFGIARALADSSATMTQTQAVVGTAQYLSPEQARGELVDARSDLYSAGCLLYELLTGQPPFTGDSPVAVAYQHVRELPEPPSSINPDISADLDAVVLHSLAKERSDRYQDAATFREDVIAARDGKPLSISGPERIPDPTVAFGGAGLAAAPETQAYPQQTATTPQPMYAASPVGGGADDGGSGFEEMLDARDEEPPRRQAPPPEKKKGRAGWIVGLSILLVLVLGGLTYWALVLNKPKEIPTFALDSVTGIQFDQAKSILNNRGLKVVRTDANDDTVPKDSVVSTDPAAGAQVKSGDVVTLTVSLGPDSVSVPDLSDQTESYAREKLRNSDLVAGENTFDYSPDIQQGNVIGTDPKNGTSVDAGTTVDLILSNGQVKVPDLIGQKTYKDACAILEGDDYKLKCKQQEVEKDPAVNPVGSVVGQSTPDGDPVDQHATITIQVAKAPPTPTVPPTTPPTEDPTIPPTAPPTGEPTDPVIP